MKKSSILIVSGEDVHLRIPSLLKLREKGYTIGVAGPKAHPRFDEKSIPFFIYHLDRKMNVRSDYVAIKKLKEIGLSFNPDIVHAFDTKPCILVPLAFAGDDRPFVVRTINGMGEIFSELTIKFMVLRIVYTLLHFVLRNRVSVTIFQNDGDMKFFKSFYLTNDKNSEKIVGSGIAVEEIEARATGDARISIRQSLHLTGKTVFILVSRMTKSKGVDVFIAAAEIVSQETDKAVFLLVGPSGKDEPNSLPRERLENLIPCVKYLGVRNDVYELMAASDYFVLPTAYREGVPRAMLEALAVGLPAIVSDTVGCIQAVKPELTGWIVPPNDPERLAQAIIKSLNVSEKERSVMTEAARQHARLNFSLAKVTDEMDLVYSKLTSDY